MLMLYRLPKLLPLPNSAVHATLAALGAAFAAFLTDKATAERRQATLEAATAAAALFLGRLLLVLHLTLGRVVALLGWWAAIRL